MITTQVSIIIKHVVCHISALKANSIQQQLTVIVSPQLYIGNKLKMQKQGLEMSQVKRMPSQAC